MFDLRGALGDENYTAFMRGMALGRYHALLGAGASATSLDRSGARLPGGQALRDEIVRDFSLPNVANVSLKRAYQLAKQRQTSSGQSINDYLQYRFTACQPHAWYDDFLKLSWNQIWTLNIDDCASVAYSALGASSRQKLISISWTDKHKQADRRRDELLLIHLHGKASRAQREGELVFDISTYLNSMTQQYRWLKIFSDEYTTHPFLIIGASLDDEIDLQTILEEGGKSREAEHPSIIALKSIDEFQREEFEGFGLLALECTAEELMTAISEEIGEFYHELAPETVLDGAGTSSEARRVLAQWRYLESHNVPSRDSSHDYFNGHEPRWSDATSGNIAPRSQSAQVIAKLTTTSADFAQSAVLLVGEKFSGKSSITLQLGLNLVKDGFIPLLFNGDEALDTEALMYWLRRTPKTILIIDDASDFSRDIKILLDSARDQNVPVKILMVERHSRADHIDKVFADRSLQRIVLADKLSTGESAALLDLLAGKRRLGVLTTKNRTDRENFVAQHERKLFSIMAALEDGRGFKTRITEEFERHQALDTRRLIVVTSLANRMGYGLPRSVLQAAVGLSARDTSDLLKGPLSDLISQDEKSVSLRHKLFGELLIGYVPVEDRVRSIIDLGRAVAPHVSPDAISQSTIYYRIARSLMGRSLLRSILAGDQDRILHVYQDLEAAYDWNARFWEQRALAASESGRFEPAFSWAQEALSRRKDAFSLNTIGVVLMQRAVQEADGGIWPSDTYEAAIDYLDQARNLEGDRAEYPIETFFTYTRAIMEKVPGLETGIKNQISNLWRIWFARFLALDSDLQARLAPSRERAMRFYEETLADSA